MLVLQTVFPKCSSNGADRKLTHPIRWACGCDKRASEDVLDISTVYLARRNLPHALQEGGLEEGEAEVPRFFDDLAVFEECAVGEGDGEEGVCGRVDEGAVVRC